MRIDRSGGDIVFFNFVLEMLYLYLFSLVVIKTSNVLLNCSIALQASMGSRNLTVPMLYFRLSTRGEKRQQKIP